MVDSQMSTDTSVASETTYTEGFPSAQNMDEFEIRLLQMGDMKSPVVMRAALDTSRQYASEGLQWTAMEAGAGFLRGDRIPSHRVEGWRNLE